MTEENTPAVKEPSRFKRWTHSLLTKHDTILRPQVPEHPGAVVVNSCIPRSFLGLQKGTPSIAVFVNDEVTLIIQGYPGINRYMDWLLKHPGLSPSAIKRHNEALLAGEVTL